MRMTILLMFLISIVILLAAKIVTRIHPSDAVFAKVKAQLMLMMMPNR